MTTLPPPSHRPPSVLGASIKGESARLHDAARGDCEEVLRLCQSTAAGLTEGEASRRLESAGPNEIAAQRPDRWPLRLLRTIRNPLVILLATLAGVSVATGDLRATIVITIMIVIGVTLRFTQESRAGAAEAALRAMIRVTATALRDGRPREIRLRDIVPGDVVVLAAGDVVPADVRLLTAKDLYVSQSALTGESLPTEKGEGSHGVGDLPLLECSNVCFLGTSVESGAATAVVVDHRAADLSRRHGTRHRAQQPPTPRSTGA